MKTLAQIPFLSAISVFMASLFLVSGCTQKEDSASTTTTVYTAGYTQNNAYKLVPCYWKNEERVDLPTIDPTKDGFANGIAVEENTVYIGGYTENAMNDAVPCYWKNGERTDLPVFNPTEFGVVEDIKVINGVVFTTGYTYNVHTVPCYWINKTRVDLPVLNPTSSGYALALDVVENTVYAAGHSGGTPCYWVNNTLVVLPALSGGGVATDIQVVANNVYVAGYTINNTFDQVPCYWFNGTRVDLPVLDKEEMNELLDLGLFEWWEIDDLPPINGWVFDLEVMENIVYMAGGNGVGNLSLSNREKSPCYWINQILVDLPAPPPPEYYSIGGLASCIDVFENTVYTAGRTINADRDAVPCYWINNNTRVDLPVIDPSKSGEARAIQVVVE